MDEETPNTSPGGGRPVTLTEVMDKLLEHDAKLIAMDTKLTTAISPVRFPMAPLWVVAISVAAIALVGCIALIDGRSPVPRERVVVIAPSATPQQ